jgi:hypothetical protein
MEADRRLVRFVRDRGVEAYGFDEGGTSIWRVGEAGGFGAGIDYPASGRLVFSIRRIREKERYSRNGRNSVCRENAISEQWRRYRQAFFPFAGGYVVMEFASYLNYRGVPVEGAVGAAGGRDSIVLATPALAKDGLCWGEGGFRCHAANGPAPGDLVIVLPDDEASLDEASEYRERGEPLFFYEPYPSIPRW